MTFEEYSKKAITTDVFGGGKQKVDSLAFMNKLLGISGETGEIMEKFKKIQRDKKSKLSTQDKQEIVKELGDLLWYINAVCVYMGINLENVAAGNLNKVLGRKSRGVVHGKGDNR